MDSKKEGLAGFTALRRQIFYPKTDLPVADAELRALRNKTDHELGLSLHRVRAAAAVAFPGEELDVRPLGQRGTFHRLFVAERSGGQRFVIRLNVTGDGWGPYTLHLEEWASAVARTAGVPTPAVVLTDTTQRACPFGFQIMDWIPGRSLQDFDENESEMERLVARFAAVLARLHGISVQGYGWFDVAPTMAQPPGTPAGIFSEWQAYLRLRLDEHVECCRRMGAFGHDAARRILNHFDNLVPRLCDFRPALLHGDPGSHNAATDGVGITALLDWEDCLAGDPVYEIAFWATFHPERRHAGFLRAYSAIRPQAQDFEIRFWLYFLRVALAKTVHRQRFGYSDRPGRPPAIYRIQTALGRLETALASDS